MTTSVGRIESGTARRARSSVAIEKAVVEKAGRGRTRKAAAAVVEAPKTAKRAAAKTAAVKAKSKSKPKAAATQSAGGLPILYMLSPAKYMSPFDSNMALDAGYKVVLPYDNVTLSDVQALVQDAIFSRPPKACTGLFIGGKDIHMALEMMSAARRAMVPPFEVSVFADPGGSFTTAAAMVASAERVLVKTFKRALKDCRVSVFGATGVVGFTSAVIAAGEGAQVQVVAHDTIEPLSVLADMGKARFGAHLEPVLGNSEARKAAIVAESDVIFTAGPAGVNIITRQQIARATNLLVAADVNAVPPMGIEGMDLFMNGVPLPGASALGIGALAIGDIKYKTQAGLFQRMLAAETPVDLDFRDAYKMARSLVIPAKGRQRKG